jgi:hypothetical protein
MKKLILLLLLTSISYSQNTFVYYYHVSSDGSISEGKCNLKIEYKNLIITFDYGTRKVEYKVISDIEKGFSDTGNPYSYFEITKNKKNYGIQIFEEDSLLRLIFNEGEYIEFYKKNPL